MSKTASMPNMVVGNLLVAEKRQPEGKCGFPSDIAGQKQQPLSMILGHYNFLNIYHFCKSKELRF